TNIADLSKHTTRYISPVLTQKVFVNMRKVGKGFSGVETPLFEKEVATNAISPTPTSPSPSSPVILSLPLHQPPCPPQPQDAEGSSLLFQRVLDTCSALALRVEGLENANAAQQLEIIKLKARVKKLEKINKVKSFKLRRLKKVVTSQRVESSDDVENDAEFEGRHADKQAEIYNIDLDHSSKVLSMQEDDTEKKDQIEMDAEYARKLQEEINKEHEEAYKNIDWNAALDHVQSKEPQVDALSEITTARAMLMLLG
nr:hypothetical protein [Tanacetum cinerariifolium]